MKIPALLALTVTAAAADLFPFQLPWDDATPSITNISWLNDKSMPPVTVKDGHLFAGEKRLRIFGVNVCFGANFPDKEMAPKVAARMAKFGINCVRFHHMDMFSAPSGIFAKDGRTLDAGQLDKLDWFIAKLKENGIYADLNLHVSRTYPDRPKDEKKGNPEFDKGVDNYSPAMIALQRDYARDLLTHVNPYTGKSYAEEPAVALVEINNENALGFQWFAGQMDDLPQVYRAELERLWGAWLRKKYPSGGEPPKAWSEGEKKAGPELIPARGTASSSRASDANAGISELSQGEQTQSLSQTKHTLTLQTQSLQGETQSREGETQSREGETQSRKGETQSRKGETQSREGETQSRDGKTQLREGKSDLAKPRWFFERHNGAEMTSSDKDWRILVDVTKAGSEAWHVQFSYGEIPVETAAYEVKFRVRAPRAGNLSVAIQQAHSPWKVLGSANLKVGTDWQEVSATITPSAADDKARLTISGMGLTVGLFEFSDFSLRTAAMDGSLSWFKTGGAAMVKKRDLARTTMAKQRDWQEFIWDTETVYWNGMRDFLKKELGVKAPIVGTQGAWSPGHVQAGMDVIDSHAYWQHPDFKGRGWNPDEWTVKNIPMAGAKDGGTLPGLAAQRVAGKPFICTEYNHAAPNTYAAETFPIICAFAALQDWDGVFAFSYSHRGGDAWSQEHFNNFFDIDRHPVKMATLPGAVVSFRRGDWIRFITEQDYGMLLETNTSQALTHGPGFAGKIGAFPPLDAFKYSVGFIPSFNPEFSTWITERPRGVMGAGRRGKGVPSTEWRRVEWDTEKQAAIISSPNTAVFIGKTMASESVEFRASRHGVSRITIRGIGALQKWASYQFTALDREPSAAFYNAKSILITATGTIENTDMRWKDAEKTSVGRNWGKAPVLVEGPKATIDLPGQGKFKAWALDERGQRREEIAVRDAKLEIGPQFKTLWYEVERQ